MATAPEICTSPMHPRYETYKTPHFIPFRGGRRFCSVPLVAFQKNGTGEPVATKPETPTPNAHNGKVRARLR